MTDIFLKIEDQNAHSNESLEDLCNQQQQEIQTKKRAQSMNIARIFAETSAKTKKKKKKKISKNSNKEKEKIIFDQKLTDK